VSAPFRFSVVIPLEFHRGQAEECLARWSRDQDVPRDRYEILAAACRSSMDEGAAAGLRALLAAHDRLLLFTEPHDIPLCARAADAARGEVLLFAESHCLPPPDALSVSERALRAHPDWAGFSGGSARLTHNRLSVAEADLYEADIRYGLEEHPWRKVLDQFFVVRAEAYRDAGGFCADLGHFAEWHLAARLHQRGHRLGYVPEIQVRHHYVGDWRPLVEFSADFARGELVFHEERTQDPCRAYFAAPSEWSSRHAWRPSLARAAARLARQSRSPGRGAWRPAELRRRWRLRARWAVRARLGPRLARWRAELRFLAALARLRLSLRLRSGGDRLRRALVRLVDATIRRERTRYLDGWLARTAGALPAIAPSPEPMSWEPGDGERWVALGFHELETWQDRPFRWSEPVGLVEVGLGPGSYRFTLTWLPIRPGVNPSVYLDEQPLAVDADECRLSGAFTLTSARVVRFSWTCAPWTPPGDPRLLGLPVASLRWEAEPAGDPAEVG
jgi:hypothetical protein